MKASRFLNLMIVSLVAMTYTSCSNSDDVIVTPDPVVKTYTMTVDAQKGSDGTRALSLDGTTLNSTWTAGETVKVYEGDTELGTLTAQSDGASTSLKGTLEGDLSVDDELTLKYLSPDYNSQTGTIASISDNCDYSVATVKVTNIVGGNISTEDADFINQQAVIKFTLKDADGSASLGNPTAFSVTDGTSTVTLTDIPDATYTTNGNGVLYVAFPASGVSATITLSATVSGVVYGLAKTDITFTNSKYYGVTVKMTEAETDVLPGKFTVSDGKQVYFSKGNLRYASGTWSFFDNQYDYYTSYSANAWDKFGWSTSATTYGMNTSTSNSTYSGNFVDWGSNSDLQTALGTGWFTLSSAEWTYLFNTRTASTVNGTTNARYTEATINTDGTGVNGIILFPDGATFADTEATWGTINGSSAWGTKCTTAQWSALEAKGCVFLPAAGNRNGSSVYNVGGNGYYWSSTAYGTRYAYFVSFNSGLLNPAYYYNRFDGYSVRLVRQE